MGFREVFFYTAAVIGFFGAAPAFIYILAQYCPYTLTDSNALCKLLSAFGMLFMLLGVIFCLLSNIALIKVGKGGAGVIGRIKLMKETEHLVTTGVYAFCRNPMHLGLILFYCGMAFVLNSLSALLIAFLTFIFAYVTALYCDEPRLKRDFKDEYTAYARKVGRFLPKIHNKYK